MRVDLDQLVTVTEAARIAGMSRQNFYKVWLMSGWVRLIRIDGRPYVFRRDAECIFDVRQRAGRDRLARRRTSR